MNIKIDTTNKVITIEDSFVSFTDLIAELDKLIPNWKEYKLQGVKHEVQYVPNYIPYYQHPCWIPQVTQCEPGIYTAPTDLITTVTYQN